MSYPQGQVIHMTPMSPVTHVTYGHSIGVAHVTYQAEIDDTHVTLTRFFIDKNQKGKTLDKESKSKPSGLANRGRNAKAARQGSAINCSEWGKG